MKVNVSVYSCAGMQFLWRSEVSYLYSLQYLTFDPLPANSPTQLLFMVYYFHNDE